MASSAPSRLRAWPCPRLAEVSDDDAHALEGGGKASTGLFEVLMPLLDAHSIPGVNLNFAEVHAAMVMAGSPIAYVKDAWPGELFCPVRCPNGRVGSDVICNVDSNFFPDRKETFRALA